MNMRDWCNGSHDRLKICCRKAQGFDFPIPHHQVNMRMNIATCFNKILLEIERKLKGIMTKKELIKFVADSTENTVKDTTEIVDTFIDYIRHSLVQHEDVVIHGFGKFTTKLRDARTARNPQTGETIEVPAKYALTFKPTSTLKAEINE